MHRVTDDGVVSTFPPPSWSESSPTPPPDRPPVGYVPYETLSPPPTDTYASWGRRAVGFAIDWVLATPILLPSYVIGPGADVDVRLLALLWIPVGGLVYLGFYATALSRTGQFLGHRVMGIRVVRTGSLDPPSWWRSAMRLLLGGLNSMVCYLGWLWPLWDRNRQTFGDMIVDTVVVRVAPMSGQVDGVGDSSATSASI